MVREVVWWVIVVVCGFVVALAPLAGWEQLHEAPGEFFGFVGMFAGILGLLILL
ncbi:MAG: hypothetical protein QOD63_997, partial [Actinomycetota bacterium]|nr:hypothetical protein [Actinomycetota bacterium]